MDKEVANYQITLLSVMTHTMCSSASVVNTLLQRYLHTFCRFQLLLGLSSLQVRGRLTTADRNSHTGEGVRGIDS